MKSSFKLGRIFGIPLGINYTWFIIFIIVTVSLALYYFPSRFHWSPLAYWIVGIITSLLFFGSVLAHELAHSLLAVRSGIPVKEITLFIFGGVSQISREATRPSTEMALALVGPLSSVVIALFFWVIGIAAAGSSEPVAAIAGYLAFINLLLAAFNMIPGFPLDGGRALRAGLWWARGDYRGATRVASLMGQGVAYLFIAAGLLIIFLSRDFFTGVWLAIIGWFLENAASSSYQEAVLRNALRGFTVRDLMNRDYLSVPPSLTLHAMVNDYFLTTIRRYFLVSQGDRLLGLMTLHNVKEVPRQRWETTTVGEVMTPADKVEVARPQEEAIETLERMDEENINQMPVVEGEKILGVIARDSLLHFIRTRAELRR
ncbi:MAG: site-2 protease family protein [Chloroflexota bacterium]|nr:site-2 protease family protein [Chloroflexota bacterium]